MNQYRTSIRTQQSARAIAAIALMAHVLTPAEALADLSFSKPIRVGAASGPGKTTAYGANGMDGGIPWVDGYGRTQVIFGDTSSATNRLCGPDDPTESDPNWPYPSAHRWSLSSSVAWSTDKNLSDGITYSDMLRDGNYFGPAIYGTGHTVPSGAAAIGFTDVVHFASTSTAQGDGFECVPGTLGISSAFMGTRTASPSGQGVFSRNDGFGTWLPGSNFAQASLLRKGGYLYMFGITAGRNGGLKLARAQATGTPTSLTWEYWSGAGWTPYESAAAFIVPPPIAEPSVAYSPQYERFILTYLDVQTGHITYRDARTPEGSWSAQKTLVRWPESPSLYGAFMYPPGATGSPQSIFFNTSNWQKSGPRNCEDSTLYNVSLYKSNLQYATPLAETSRGNIVTDPGFNDYLCTPTVSNSCGSLEMDKALVLGGGKWLPIPLTEGPNGPCPTDVDCRDRNPEVRVSRSFLGAPAKVRLTGSSGWRGVAQRIAVRPWSKYIIELTGSWSIADAYIGAHGISGISLNDGSSTCDGVTWPTESLAQTYLGSSGSGLYTLIVYTGQYSMVELFGGYVGTGYSGNMEVDTLDMRQADVVSDGGFEMQDVPLSNLQAPYLSEGPGTKHVGNWGMPGNAVEIADEQSGTWNALTQLVTVRPGTYRLHADVASSGNFSVGYMGVRTTSGSILAETSYPDDPYYHEREVYFTVGGTSDVQLRVFVGYWSGFSQAYWSNIVVDNIGLEEATL